MSKATAQKLVNTANEMGWSVDVRNDVLTITKNIKVDDKESFVSADSEYYSILSILPQTRPGSIWGTDGGGIGALSASKSGLFVMNKSGGNKRVLNAIKKFVG